MFVCVCVSLQSEPVRVLVTGAAGQIAYSLLYSIGNGSVFGKDQVGASMCKSKVLGIIIMLIKPCV